MKISIIAAIAENSVIGKDNHMNWHISEDLKRFKATTLNHSVIMGRKTYEHLDFKPLPKRKNIVISSQEIEYEGAIVVKSIKEALDLCLDEDEVFVCGGAIVYKQFMDIAHKMYLTFVNHSFEGDTFFPEINFDDWDVTETSETFTDSKNGLMFYYVNYSRKINS